MKKSLFAVGVVVALAALAAVALTSRPDPVASASSAPVSDAGPNVETRVIERTVRVKRRSEDGAISSAGVTRRDDDDAEREGDDDRFEREGHDDDDHGERQDDRFEREGRGDDDRFEREDHDDDRDEHGGGGDDD